MSNDLVKRTLNPFEADTSVFEKCMAIILDSLEKEDGIEALHSNRSFRPDMIRNMHQSQTAGEALTAHLGKGFWSEWNWSAEETQSALVNFTERRRLLKWAMDQYNRREKQVYGYVRELH